MKKLLIILSLISAYPSFAKGKLDQPLKCSYIPEDLTRFKGAIVSEVRQARDYYMNSSAPDAGNSYEERTSKLNNKVKEIFRKFRDERINQYNQVSCRFYKTDWCTNGNRGCYSARTLAIPGNYVLLTETIKYTQNGDMKKKPTITKNSIYWETGTHGKHAETFVQIDTKYTNDYIKSVIDGEVKQIQIELNNQSLPGGNLDV